MDEITCTIRSGINGSVSPAIGKQISCFPSVMAEAGKWY
jgi:hypothetical protein